MFRGDLFVTIAEIHTFIIDVCVCLHICRAKAKDCYFVLGRKLVIDIFGTFKISFIM